MLKDDRKVLTFAAIVCVTCSLLLSGAASLLKEKQEYNVELDRKVNVLKAFGEPVKNAKGKRIVSGEEVDTLFAKHITEIIIDPATGEVLEGVTSSGLTKEETKLKTKLPLYVWSDDGAPTRYAFPISGYGLWSTIYGYMAIDKDLTTVIGVTFYDHGETPGLGGEVSMPWFQEQFAGTKVRQEPFDIVKGGAPPDCDHCVDGIAAATITSDGVEKFINADLANYELYFKSISGT